MNKLVLALLSLIMTVTLLGCSGQASSAPLNKTIEVPEGALSFMISDSWMIEEEAVGDSLGIIYPLGNRKDIKIIYGKTSFGSTSNEHLTDMIFMDIINRYEAVNSNESNFTILEIDSSLSDYYYSAHSYDWEQADFGMCRCYYICIVDSSGISSITLRVPLDMIAQWEDKILELAKSVRALPGAETKEQLATSDPSNDVHIASGIVGEWDEPAGGWYYVFNEDGTGWNTYRNSKDDFIYEITETNLVLHLGSGSFNGAAAAIEPQDIEYTLDGDNLHLHFLNSDYELYLVRQ